MKKIFMLKNNVEWKELEKLGFELGENSTCISYGSYGRKMKQQELCNIKIDDNTDVLFIPTIEKKSRKIELEITMEKGNRSFSYTDLNLVKPYIEDLIQFNLIEELEED